MKLLEINDLHATVAAKNILNGVNLSVGKGEIHAIMGPNGSGKSTLGNVLMGSPKCTVTSGSVLYNGEDLLALAPHERARKGVFLAFQHPVEIHGLKYFSFLKRALESGANEKPSVAEFKKMLDLRLGELALPTEFSARDVNHGFSGGEKKRAEVVQLRLLNPSLALLDEIDSGLDVDTLKITALEIAKWQKETGASIVVMTHYKRILDYLRPHFVHVMVDGRIARSGGASLADEIDARGYGVVSTSEKTASQASAEPEEYGSLLKLNKQKAPHGKGGRLDLKPV